MPAVDHYLTWLSAMHAEAARLHQREIEPEHMLLGLLAQGGTAAAVLAAHGVTLARARAAVDDMTHADLARVGISLPDALRPEPISAEELTAKAGGEIPLSDTAAEFIDNKGTSLITSAQALQALISSSAVSLQSPVVRLLAHCGVDVEYLRTELSEIAADEEPARGRYRMTDEYRGYGLDRDLSQERFISASAAQLAALLRERDRLTWWALPRQQLVDVLPDGAVQRVEGRRRTAFLRWRLETAVDRRITWSCTVVSGRRDGEVAFVKDLHLIEAPGGTRVRLVLAHRTWGGWGRCSTRSSGAGLVWGWRTRSPVSHGLQRRTPEPSREPGMDLGACRVPEYGTR